MHELQPVTLFILYPMVPMLHDNKLPLILLFALLQLSDDKQHKFLITTPDVLVEIGQIEAAE